MSSVSTSLAGRSHPSARGGRLALGPASLNVLVPNWKEAPLSNSSDIRAVIGHAWSHAISVITEVRPHVGMAQCSPIQSPGLRVRRGGFPNLFWVYQPRKDYKTWRYNREGEDRLIFDSSLFPSGMLQSKSEPLGWDQPNSPPQPSPIFCFSEFSQHLQTPPSTVVMTHILSCNL